MEKLLFLTNMDRSAVAATEKLMADSGFELVVRPTVDEWPDESAGVDIALILISQQPPLDSVKTCARIRNWSDLPIIVLDSRADTIDMLVAMEMGADDFMVLPCKGVGLVARVRALLRRYAFVKRELTWSRLLQ
jgi:DNA-binding response OmpR family regulator